MKVTVTPIAGLYQVDINAHADERGMFARTWDASTAKEHNLVEQFNYSCVSTNIKEYTLRGMHYQADPHAEVKLVRCTSGAMFDVVVDLRPDSATFKQWISAELTAENHQALYIPIGCAHGFITLQPNTEVLYCIAGEYNAAAAAGVRWNDSAFGITWPVEPVVIAERDAAYPDFI